MFSTKDKILDILFGKPQNYVYPWGDQEVFKEVRFFNEEPVTMFAQLEQRVLARPLLRSRPIGARSVIAVSVPEGIFIDQPTKRYQFVVPWPLPYLPAPSNDDYTRDHMHINIMNYVLTKRAKHKAENKGKW